MDRRICDKNRKNVEFHEIENSKRKNLDGKVSSGDRVLIVGSTIDKKVPDAVAAVIAMNSGCGRTRSATKSVSPQGKTVRNSRRSFVDKNIDDTKKTEEPVDRLRRMKKECSLRSAARKCNLRDAQISSATFFQGVRALDTVCRLTPTTQKRENAVRSLGLQPFVSIKRIDEKPLVFNQQKGMTAERWSMAEDIEEDMFADVKYNENHSDESLHGFSNRESQHSRDKAERSSHLMRSDETCGTKRDSDNSNDYWVFHGFTPREMSMSVKLSTTFLINEVASSDLDESFEDAVEAQNIAPASLESLQSEAAWPDGKILEAQKAETKSLPPGEVVIATDGRVTSKSENLPRRRSTRRLATIEPRRFSSPDKRANSVPERSQRSGRITSPVGIPIIKNESRNTPSLEGSPESKKSPKTATFSRRSGGSETSGGRPTNVSETAVKKAQSNFAAGKSRIDIEGGEDNNSYSSSTRRFSSTDKRPINDSPKKARFGSKNRSSEDLLGTSRRSGGFETGHGRPINISEIALKKAQTFHTAEISKIGQEYPDLDIVSEFRVSIESAVITAQRGSAKLDDREPTSSKEPTPRCPAKEAMIKGSKGLTSISAREKSLQFSESGNSCNSEAAPELGSSSSIPGFSTAGGRPINVSEAAFKKVQNFHVEAIASFEATNNPGSMLTTPAPRNLSQGSTDTPCKFSTASDRQSSLSDSAIQKARTIFSAGSSSIDEDAHEHRKSEGAPGSKISTKPATNTPNLGGWTTASCRPIKLCNSAAMIAAHKLYSEVASSELNSITNQSPNLTTEETTNRPEAPGKQFPNYASTSKTETPIGKTHLTAQPSSVSAADPAIEFEDFESLNLDDFVDPIDVDQTIKRKAEEVDDDTPLRRDAGLKLKRGRYVSELQARKLFREDSSSEDDAPILRTEAGDAKSNVEDTSAENTYKSAMPPGKVPITEKIDAAAVATTWTIGNSHNAKVEGEPDTVKKESISPELADTDNVDEKSRFKDIKPVNHLDIEPEVIPDDLAFDTQFSQDHENCVSSPALDQFLFQTMKMMEARSAMRRKQDEIIKGKRRAKPDPCDGFLYTLKTSNPRISWAELTKGTAPTLRETDDKSLEIDVFSVTSTSAVSYSFRCADLFGSRNVGVNAEGIKVGDDAFLILDENNRAGVHEFEQAFLASPGVDPDLVPTGWVKNHYRWIVWKLASMDRVDFNNKCLPKMLTPDRVMYELKYRYDREIHRTQWPPLRRILERNEDVSARIVLCVASISISEKGIDAPTKTPNTPSSSRPLYKMKLTDGWYCIDASIDFAMIDCIKSGKVREGTKLMIFGAKTLNLDQGCSALEIPSDVSLRIHTNSTRRAKWDTKLDFYRANRGPMLLSLKSMKVNGGMISKIIVSVARLYPILHREKLPNGEFVFRNERSEDEAALAHESRRNAKYEEICANVRTEFQLALESRKRHDRTNERCSMDHSASNYREWEEEIRQKIMSKSQEALPPPRDVTQVMKIRITEGDTNAMLTVWSNVRDTGMFAEGSTIEIRNVYVSRQRLNELHISSNRSSFFKREPTHKVAYPPRIYTPLEKAGEADFNPVYGEFDTIGVVTSIGPAPYGMKNFETVNLACPRTEETSSSGYLSILFWQGVSACGYSKILTIGSLVACSNLEVRKTTAKKIPTAYTTERSVFTKNPRSKHLREAFETLRLQIEEPSAYAASRATVIEEEIAKESALRTPGKGTPYKPTASSTNTTPGWTPRDSRSSINTNRTPLNDSKKAVVMRRLKRLEASGGAPNLPPNVVINSSRKALSDFRPPVVTPVRKT